MMSHRGLHAWMEGWMYIVNVFATKSKQSLQLADFQLPLRSPDVRRLRLCKDV